MSSPLPLPPESPFPDIQQLLDASQPRPRIPWSRLLIACFVAGLVIYVMFAHESAQTEQAVTAIGVSLAVVFSIFSAINISALRRRRAANAQLQAIEEFIQLRQWPQAALALQSFLSQPADSMQARAQALLYTAMVLARYHQFEGSAALHEYLLEHVSMDEGASHAVRLGRTMALLREDHLLDADRAIMDLRRSSRGTDSPGLALVEIYRDVKTGHPNEAIEIFEKQLDSMRKHLGHRVADAWALAARAYDMLDRGVEAGIAFQNATLLLPLVELCRRYPEIKSLPGKYAPAVAPPEMA